MVHICCLVRRDFCSCVMANQIRHAPAAKKNDKQVLKNIKNVTRCRDSRTAKCKETRYGWSHITVKYSNPLHIFLRNTRIMEKDPCWGVVYLTVLCDYPYLVSLIDTFTMVFTQLETTAFSTEQCTSPSLFLQVWSLTRQFQLLTEEL